MVEALLITRPKIDLENLFRFTSQGLGFSVSKSIDESHTELSDDAKFISALSSLSWYDKLSARDQLHKADHELYFLHYTFLMYADSDTARLVREWTKLDSNSSYTVDGGVLFVAGATLDKWQEAVINCCSDRASPKLRLLFDKVLLQFERVGLQELWSGYRKRMLNDRTFLLEDKR